MPLLTITTSVEPDVSTKEPFFEDLAETYAVIMDSETRFLSIVFHSIDRTDLWLGRATDPADDLVILEADIRRGRPVAQRREFAIAAMERFQEEWNVPRPNMKVVFTEHDGPQMMGYDRIGGDWEADNE